VRGSLTLRLAHRTAFSPPGLGDQFFRSGIGIEANPELRAERADELELGVRWQRTAISVEAAAFTGGIDDLIVWAPDYRFVWSPQNENVARRGAELSGRARRAHWQASASFTHARITYDRIAGDVQVAYRPRNTGRFSLEHQADRFDLRLESSYIGQRTTAPTALNTLPGFWTTGAAIAARAQPHNIATTISLRADRLLNEKGTLIFGFPDPGRQFVLELRLGGSHSSTLSARTSQ
jgi:outer membrane cobalamin receptor